MQKGHGLAFYGLTVMIKKPTIATQGCGERGAKDNHTNIYPFKVFSSNF